MRINKKALYFSYLGFILSLVQNCYRFLVKPRMIYGYWQLVPFRFLKNVRISSTVTLMFKKGISLDNNVWIWHHSIIDGSNGVSIGEGCQIGAWVGIFTHSSHIAIRLYGSDSFIRTDLEDRKGYIKGSVEIGDHCFIGAGALIMPGVKIGRGSLIAAGTLVNKDIPDFSIVVGSPCMVKGSTLDLDKKYLKEFGLEESYFLNINKGKR